MLFARIKIMAQINCCNLISYVINTYDSLVCYAFKKYKIIKYFKAYSNFKHPLYSIL